MLVFGAFEDSSLPSLPTIILQLLLLEINKGIDGKESNVNNAMYQFDVNAVLNP